MASSLHLLTTKSLAQSLSPPRSPPFGSNERKSIEGKRGHGAEIAHPHLLKAPVFGDRVTRTMGRALPDPWINFIRDSGGFRSIVDSLILVGGPLGVGPTSVARWIEASRKAEKLTYGEHPSQNIEVIETSTDGPLTVFIHGGAWGSGAPFMYRLVSRTFTSVALVGYRTYPSAKTIEEQMDDCKRAIDLIVSRYPTRQLILAGHSSGAHVALLLLVEQARRYLLDPTYPMWPFDAFIGLSGPFNVSHHFDYEAGRGVEELSPLKPINGFDRKSLLWNSPAVRLIRMLRHSSVDDKNVSRAFPRRFLLLHGVEDETVPYTATSEAASMLRSCGVVQCQEMYLGDHVGHQDTVLQLMIGGCTRDELQKWMSLSYLTETNAVVRSKL